MTETTYLSKPYGYGITFGCFDLFHAGHRHLINSMMDMCECVIIGLHVDPSVERPEKNKPIQSLLERFYQLSSLDSSEVMVTVVPYETEGDILTILSIYQADARFLGQDYEGKTFTGKSYCEKEGIALEYISREHGWSTSSLRGRIVNASK